MKTDVKKWDIITDSVSWTILIIAGLLSWPVIAIVFDSVSVFIALIILTGILAFLITFIAWLIKKLFRKKTSFFKTGAITHFGLFISSMILLSIPMWAAIIINSTIPVTLPTITLTDGEKTVVYQGMIHIGSENYYKSIIFDMVAAGDDFVFFYEGVTDGSEENEARFDNIMGFGGPNQNVNDGYIVVSRVCDLYFQGEFFWVFMDDMAENSEQHIHMDVSVDEMIEEWDRLLIEHPDYAAAELPLPTPEPNPPIAAGESNSSSNSSSSSLTSGQRQFVSRFCQAAISIFINGDDGTIEDPFTREVILDFRDRHLANGIINADADKIFITYGSAHFPGVYAYLKEDNPDWEIINVRWKRALELSQDVVGTLDVDP